MGAESGALPDAEVKRLLLYDAFIREILAEVRRELQKQLDEASIFVKLREKLGTRRTEVFESLDELLQGSPFKDFVDVTGFKAVSAKESNKNKRLNSQNDTASVSASVSSHGVASVKAEIKDDRTQSDQSEIESENQFSHILLRKLNI